MKIGGVTVTSNEEVLVLPRALGEDIVIKACAVDMDDFEDAHPKPEMPKRIVRGGVEDHADSPAYRTAIEAWGERRFEYMILKSLEPSEIEWETVDIDKSKTWKNWTTELQAAGFASTECKRIINCILVANSLSESKLAEARDAFLRGQGSELERSSGLDTEPQSTPSGQPANDGE